MASSDLQRAPIPRRAGPAQPLDCLLNLQFEKNFYPLLDIERLYKILTTESSLELMQPLLAGIPRETRRKAPSEKSFDASGDKYQRWMKQQRDKYEQEKSKKTSTGSTEAPRIDKDKKMRPFDESRIYLILEFFTSHFIEMAKKSNEYRNKGQSYFYMQAAKNLLKVLDDMNFGERDKVRSKKAEMAKLEENVNFQMYFKDYWNISFSHPQLGSSNSFRPSPLDLPDAPRVLTETAPGTESLPRPADVIKVSVDVHQNVVPQKSDSEESDNDENEDWTYL